MSCLFDALLLVSLVLVSAVNFPPWILIYLLFVSTPFLFFALLFFLVLFTFVIEVLFWLALSIVSSCPFVVFCNFLRMLFCVAESNSAAFPFKFNLIIFRFASNIVSICKHATCSWCASKPLYALLPLIIWRNSSTSFNANSIFFAPITPILVLPFPALFSIPFFVANLFYLFFFFSAIIWCCVLVNSDFIFLDWIFLNGSELKYLH